MSRQTICTVFLSLGLTAPLYGQSRRDPPPARVDQKLNLNTATEEQLKELPGVGEATARKIVAARPFKSVDDLDRAGLSKTAIDRLRDRVIVRTVSVLGPMPIGKLNINTATSEQLQELTG